MKSELKRSEVKADLQDFLSHETGNSAINEALDLIDSGLLDSLLVMSLVAFIERRYGICSQPSDITPARFRSINTLADWVLNHQVSVARNV